MPQVYDCNHSILLRSFQVSSPEQVIPFAVIHLDPDTLSIASQSTFSEDVGQEWGDLGDTASFGRPRMGRIVDFVKTEFPNICFLALNGQFSYF